MSIDLDYLRGLAERSIPELSANPWYLIWQPSELPAPTCSRGYAISASPAIKHHLESAGLWRGEGPCIVLVDQTMSREQTLQVFAHELGHCLPVTEHAPIDCTLEAVADDMQMLTAWCRDSEPAFATIPAWVAGHHDQAFIRRCMHVWWRFALQGEFVPLDSMCGSWLYDFSAEYAYWCALGCEPIRMQHLTFAEIEQTPAPELFNQFWRGDVERWLRNHPGCKEYAA